MAEQVYEIEALRKQALDALRQGDKWMSPGQIALAVGVPLWALLPAMESARLAGLAVWDAASSQWCLGAQDAPRIVDQAGLGLIGGGS